MMNDNVTLKEYFERILEEKDKAVNIALAAAKEAVGVAEKNAEKWRDNANEWRQAMNDREVKFMPRAEFEAYKDATEKALSLEKSRGDKGIGRDEAVEKGIKKSQWTIGTVITIIFSTLAFIFVVINFVTRMAGK